MANEYQCSKCGGDATRCGCPSGGAPYVDPEQQRAERIAQNEETLLAARTVLLMESLRASLRRRRAR